MAQKKTALTLALGTAFAASLAASPALRAADNPFEMDSLKNGYQVAQADKQKDGKCGDGICDEVERSRGVCAQDCTSGAASGTTSAPTSTVPGLSKPGAQP